MNLNYLLNPTPVESEESPNGSNVFDGIQGHYENNMNTIGKKKIQILF